ncbi:MAG: NADH-quinone oxidoreductase subunit N [Candidatus Heimdallarchaeota archaeon]|nr:NADH-quinone oxidoreductase subunit N [Candidatus Heimdallarchaeota archaeon]
MVLKERIKITLSDAINTWSPFIILVVGILIVLMLDLFFREKAEKWVVGTTILVLVGDALFIIGRNLDTASRNQDLFKFGHFFEFFAVIALLSSTIVVFSAWKDMNLEIDLGVFYSLLLLSNLGALLVASSQNFIPLYIGYELVSIPTYAMVAFRKKSKPSAEAAMKIFLLGALSSAIMIYGLSMYYGATGSFNFGTEALGDSHGLQLIAIALIAAGSGFKIGLVPFHFWIPDVYSGASVSVVNFLSASSKKMAFAFVFQIFFVGMPLWAEDWGILFAILATLSVIVGNIAAVVQDKLLRIIAYSTIAQAGYITMGIAAFGVGLENNDTGLQESAMFGILFHIIAHVLMKGAAIAVILLVISSYDGDDNIENFRGLIHKDPLLGGSLAIALFSLMGIPPLAGFFGKFLLFLAVVEADLLWLAIIGIIGSAISVFYYARVIRIMVDKPEDKVEIVEFTPLKFMIVLLSILTMVMAIFSDDILTKAKDIVSDLL